MNRHHGSVKLIYFSPTRTTRKVLEGIALGLNADKVEHIDLTAPESETTDPIPLNDDFVLMGAPVYAGRIPPDAIKRFNRIAARNTPAAIIVVYGNRAYDDALLELKDLSLERGLTPFAGGAFIGEHSYANGTVPIANGRPDEKDLEKAKEFGKLILDRMDHIHGLTGLPPLEVPGSFPYVEHGVRPMESPVTKDAFCTICGTCAAVCPTAAIEVQDEVLTDSDSCIVCCACVKNCPTGARVMDSEIMRQRAEWLSRQFSERKEPEIFM
jgi:ferredoxin